MVAFRIVKGVHKTSATFCSTGKAAHKVNSSLWKRGLRRTGRAVIRDHVGFINVGMSEVLERRSEFQKHTWAPFCRAGLAVKGPECEG